MVKYLLEFDGGFCATLEFQISQAAQVLRPELGSSFVAIGGLQLLYRLRRIAALQFHGAADRGRPFAVDQGWVSLSPNQAAVASLRYHRLRRQSDTNRCEYS